MMTENDRLVIFVSHALVKFWPIEGSPWDRISDADIVHFVEEERGENRLSLNIADAISRANAIYDDRLEGHIK